MSKPTLSVQKLSCRNTHRTQHKRVFGIYIMNFNFFFVPFLYSIILWQQSLYIKTLILFTLH